MTHKGGTGSGSRGDWSCGEFVALLAYASPVRPGVLCILRIISCRGCSCCHAVRRTRDTIVGLRFGGGSARRGGGRGYALLFSSQGCSAAPKGTGLRFGGGSSQQDQHGRRSADIGVMRAVCPLFRQSVAGSRGGTASGVFAVRTLSVHNAVGEPGSRGKCSPAYVIVECDLSLDTAMPRVARMRDSLGVQVVLCGAHW